MTRYSAVVTTGIYCRPGCAARPLVQNTRTFELAAAAEAAGFRACHRCRPYRVAGPVGSNAPELVCEAVQLIIGGALDDNGTEAALARDVGMSPRHLRRLFLKHLGASPDQLARSRRAHFARRLLDDTDLSIIDVAFASGFGSLRQFNRSMHDVFHASPSGLRERRHRADRLVADGGLALRIPVAPDYDWDAVRSFLAARAIPGVEAVDGETYRRTITVAGEPGMLEITSLGAIGVTGDFLLLRAHLPYWEGLIHIVERVARVLGTDADHAIELIALRADPLLSALAESGSGFVVPGAWNQFEAGVWTILSDKPERERLLGAFVEHLGTPVPGLPDGLTHTFPDPATVTSGSLASAGVPNSKANAIMLLADALTDGRPVRTSPDQWGPWLAFAAAHLLSRADAVAGASVPT